MNTNKEYYTLKELIPLVNLQYTQLKIRIRTIKTKYKGSELLYKKSNRFFIHKSIIHEFRRKRKPIKYKSFITITPEGDYSRKFLRGFVRYIYGQMKEESPLERMKWVEETTRRGLLHIHILTTFNRQSQIRSYIRKHPLGHTNLNMNFVRITDDIHLRNAHKYMRKQNKPELFK